MFSKQNRVVSYRLVITCASALIAATCCLTARGQEQQQYTVAKITLPRDQLGKAKVAFESAVRNPAGFGAAEADVNTYLKTYFFPLMTQIAPNNLAELADLRKKLMTQYIGQAANAGSQQYLIDQTFTFARGMARGNFHPAVRYNAVLMLGDLDQQLATATNPPVPHAKATLELLELVEQDKINRIEVPEAVKLGALLGLERHTRYGIDPALGERLTKTTIAVMASPTPEDVEPAVHDWVRSSAAAVLANQYAKTPTKEVQAALTNLIADKKVGLDDRCTAAGALKRITYAPGGDIDGDATVAALAVLTLDVITDAAKLARDYQEEALGEAERSGGFNRRGYGGGEYGGRGYGGGYGGGYGSEEDMGPQFERRQLFARLFSLAAGGNSLKAGLDDEGKSRIEALIAELQPVVQVMDDKNATEVDVTEEVIALEGSLKNLVQSWELPGAEANAEKPAEGFAER